MEGFKEWHDFYLVIGTAAATLIGAMFVVASIGGRFINQTPSGSIGLRIFTTPTVMNLAVVLFGCALVFVPVLSARGFGVVMGAGAVIGLIYAGRNAFHIAKRESHWSDHLWYAAAPFAAYALASGAAVLLLLDRLEGIEIFAAALGLSLAAGVRNAWDLIIFFVGQPPEPD